MESKSFRVAFPRAAPAASYDPVKIHFSSEYCFLQNIYSPLVEYSPNGELVSAVAERFEWVGSEAHFKIRPGLRTIDGRPIDARDVETTLKRMLLIGGNTHGDLKEMLCPGTSLKRIDDVCPGMEVRDNGGTLVIKLRKRKIFLFPMLASIDFAVIPRGSIDPKTLAINDYRNTSGPYYVEKDRGDGRIELAANHRHFRYSDRMPLRVVLVPTKNRDNPRESLELFAAGKVDHVTTKDKAGHAAMFEFARTRGDVNVHSTYPLDLVGVSFTPKGRKRLSEKERIVVGKALRKAFWVRQGNAPGSEPAVQLFPVVGEGALSGEQLSKVKSRFDAVGDDEVMRKKVVGWNVNLGDNIDPDDPDLKRLLPNMSLLRVGKIPGLVDYAAEKLEEPDFSLSKGDSGFQEDIGLLAYYLNTDLFWYYGEEGKAWLVKYMAVADKKERLELLRDMHFKTILHAATVPIAMRPYTALVRKPWVFGLSRMHASNPIWRIRRE